MKPSEFYEGTEQTNNIVITDYITTIADPDADYMAAYYMGYVNFYRFPENLKLHRMQIDDGSIVISNQPDRNHSWGFCNVAQTSGISYSDVIYTYNGAIESINSDAHARFINSAKMSQYAAANWLRVSIRYIIIPDADLDTNETAYSPVPGSGAYEMRVVNFDMPVISAMIGGVNYAGFDAFLNDDQTLEINNISIGGNTLSVEFSASDFENDENPTCKKQITINNVNYTLYAQITAFYFYDYSHYISDSNVSDNFGIVPFIECDALFDNDGMKTMLIGTQGSATQLQINLDYYTGDFITTATVRTGHISGGYYQGNFYIENDLMYKGAGAASYWYGSNTSVHYPGLSRNGIIRGRHITDYASGSANNFYIYTFMRPIDIWNSIVQYHKIDALHNANNVVPNKTYTPDYSTTIFNQNIPTTERKQENLINLEDILMDWQMPDNAITINDYVYSDMPINPQPDPEGDAENVGDSVTRPSTLGVGGTYGFVTQYALNAAQVQGLGSLLWTSVFDSDYWKNYLFNLAIDTGSFLTSSLLSFFISLKVYPFSLVNVPSYNAIGNNMYIGSGLRPLQSSTPLHAINNYVDYIPGGTCTVDSKYFYHDYRDYIKAKYTLYVPYCGTVELNPGDVVGATLSIQYAVDFATGGCIAYCDCLANGKSFPVAILPGQIGADIPMTSTAAGQVAARFFGDAMKFGGLLGGEVAGVASGISGVVSDADSSSIHGVPGGSVLSGIAGMYAGAPGAMGSDLAPGFAMKAANILTRGAVSAPMLAGGAGFASFGAPQKPFLQIRRSIYPEISAFDSLYNRPSAGSYTLGSLSGFVQGDVKTDGLSCPENEKQEIRSLIAAGIYV